MVLGQKEPEGKVNVEAEYLEYYNNPEKKWQKLKTKLMTLRIKGGRTKKKSAGKIKRNCLLTIWEK